jgi:hypothetical protein
MEHDVFLGLGAAALRGIAPGAEVKLLRLVPKNCWDGDSQIAAGRDGDNGRWPRTWFNAIDSNAEEEKPTGFAVCHDGLPVGAFLRISEGSR